ncbi:MAG: flagellar biosynthetic protein FliP, partial [Planctomycetota bacterium]
MGPESPEVLTFLDQVSQSGAIEGLAPPLRIALMLGAMAFLSIALVSLTAFTRIIIVLSFVKRSLTTQEIPPNQVVIGLALFLTAFVMGPTLDELQHEAITPYLNESMTGVEAIQIASVKMHAFMLRQTR